MIPNKHFRNNSISDVFPAAGFLDTAAAACTCLPSVVCRLSNEKHAGCVKKNARRLLQNRLTRVLWRIFHQIHVMISPWDYSNTCNDVAIGSFSVYLCCSSGENYGGNIQ